MRSSSGSGRVSEPEDELPERDPLPPSNMVLRKRIKRIRQGMRRYYVIHAFILYFMEFCCIFSYCQGLTSDVNYLACWRILHSLLDKWAFDIHMS